jgi:hypothetical protein
MLNGELVMRYPKRAAWYGELLRGALGFFVLLVVPVCAQEIPQREKADERGKSEAWLSYAHDVQHTGISGAASQPLQRIRWTMPVDLDPQLTSGELLTHYGSPLITEENTVIVPVKTGAFDGFRVEARNGKNGSVKWILDSDYSVPFAGFTPPFGPVVTKGRLVLPGTGGTVLVRDRVDEPHGKLTRLAFYGIEHFNADPTTFTIDVRINTPITADSEGNLFFGFNIVGVPLSGLESGIARIGRNGKGSWISAATASSDPKITKVNTSCAPALSKDQRHLFVAVSSDFAPGGYLLELDARTLKTVNQVALKDPQSGLDPFISDSSSATPTVGPDGDVYFGVLEAPFPGHHDRGWLLHFSADLKQTKLPGGFGWDDTASVVDASLVKSYHGTSKYLLLTKYNDYADLGGTGVNKIAILDPNISMPDFIYGIPVMNEVLTITGPTPDPRFPSLPGAVREWCINTAAVDPFTKSALVNSEDGKLYRWDLTKNRFSEVITITGGILEAYTPTVIGTDGTVYAINRGVLFAVGGSCEEDSSMDGHTCEQSENDSSRRP